MERPKKALGPREASGKTLTVGRNNELASASSAASSHSAKPSGSKSSNASNSGAGSPRVAAGGSDLEKSLRRDQDPSLAAATAVERRKKASSSAPKQPTGVAGTVFAEMPLLREAPREEQRALLLRKLQACARVYDFHAETQIAEKEGKRRALLELVEHIKGTKNLFDEELMQKTVEMVGANLFRTLTKRERTPLDLLDAEEEGDTIFDVAWSHVEPVYQIITRVVAVKDLPEGLLAKHLDRRFLTCLVDLFDSDDLRERELLKTLMNRLCGKLSSLKSIISTAVQDACLKALHDTDQVHTVAEPLEVLGRIISGYSAPLQPASRSVLSNVLIPLHKAPGFSLFHSQLTDCVRKFTDKDSRVAGEVVAALLKFWPVTHGFKQILFLEELETLLGLLPQREFARLQEPLARRMAACLSNNNSDVAEKALTLWRSERLVKIFVKNCRDHLKEIVTALYRNCSEHWHPRVHSSTIDVLKLLMEADAELFDQSSAKHRKEVEEGERREAERQRKWSVLQDLHARQQLLAGAASARRGAGPGGEAAPGVAHLKKRRTARELAGARGAGGAEASNSPARSSASQRAPPLHRSSSSLTRSNGTVTTALPSASETFGVAVYWEDAGGGVVLGKPGAKPEFELQGLLVDERGRIINAVHMNNLSASKGALSYGPDAGIIWVTLARLPPQAQLVVLVLGAAMSQQPNGRPPGTGAETRVIRVVDWEAEDRPVIAEQGLERGSGTAGVVAVIQRCKVEGGPDSWNLHLMESYGKAGRHFMDILDTVLNRVVREALPSTMPRRARAMMTMSCLEAGAVADLPQPAQARWLFVGTGWDLTPSAEQPGTAALRLGAVLLGQNGQSIGVASAEKGDTQSGLRHSGDGLLGAGLILDLNMVQPEVQQIFLVCNLAGAGEGRLKMAPIQRPHCCVVDASGNELLRYTMDHEGTGGLGPRFAPAAILTARLLRNEELGRWSFQALGSPLSEVQTWKDCVRAVMPLFRQTLREVQVGLLGGTAAAGSMISTSMKQSIITL